MLNVRELNWTGLRVQNWWGLSHSSHSVQQTSCAIMDVVKTLGLVRTRIKLLVFPNFRHIMVPWYGFLEMLENRLLVIPVHKKCFKAGPKVLGGMLGRLEKVHTSCGLFIPQYLIISSYKFLRLSTVLNQDWCYHPSLFSYKQYT